MKNLKRNISQMIFLLLTIQSTGSANPVVRDYRCQAQCFALDFNEGWSQSFGQTVAKAKNRSDAFIMASQRCRRKVVNQGLDRSLAFLVTALRSEHSRHDAEHQSTFDSEMTSRYSAGAAIVFRGRRGISRFRGGALAATSGESTSSTHAESSSSEHSESHEIEAEFARPDINCELIERDADEAPIYDGDLDVRG